MRAIAALALASLSWLLPKEAAAFERQQGFGLDAGWAMLSIGNQSAELGVAYGLHYSYAITDQLDIVGELGGAITDLHPIVTSMSLPNRPSRMWSLDAGLLYKLDVVRFVPYFGALAGGYLLAGGSLPSTQPYPGVEIAAGADYLINRRWAVGLAIREHLLFTDLSTYPTYLTVTGRVEFTWGGL